MAGRKPKIPPSPFNGITVSMWQSSDAYVEWARRDEMFSLVLSVIQNGFMGVRPEDFAGYRQAMENLLALRVGAPKPQPQPQPTYSEALEEMQLATEQAGD